jgi:predicted ATP-dependent endonuclease of OLD family
MFPLFTAESALPRLETTKDNNGEKERREEMIQKDQLLQLLKPSIIGRNGTGNTNIVKALGMVFGSASCRDDQCENDEPQNDQDLHTAEIEFEFSENADTEIVDGNDGSKEQCYVQRWMACGSVISSLIEPVFDDKGRRDEIVRRGDDVLCS